MVRAPHVPHRQTASGSTPHDDRHAASRLATPFLLASGRAPEHQGAVFNSSAVLPQAPRSPPTLAGSAAKKLSVFIPAANYPRHQTPKSHQRLVRDPKIPIGRAQPNSALPTRSFLLGRLSNASPTTRTTVQKGPASEALHEAVAVVAVD